jgi:altronate hydrolase
MLKKQLLAHRGLFPNVDGIKFLNHQGGCGGTRQDAAILGKLLAAYADHPNVAGITVLSLGCQNLAGKGFRNLSQSEKSPTLTNLYSFLNNNNPKAKSN